MVKKIGEYLMVVEMSGSDVYITMWQSMVKLLELKCVFVRDVQEFGVELVRIVIV